MAKELPEEAEPTLSIQYYRFRERMGWAELHVDSNAAVSARKPYSLLA